ncbi:hypothetical protein P43SY_012102 [Pythium insidiosum]|uniref:Uncharacterized protein n=1 Tax=Pythium insidiosum TaxID=114742 RepID=A0AAD5L6V5_PYTIN|nr:hypothetical protein P43SY_012102 [Pythium insidiosum]
MKQDVALHCTAVRLGCGATSGALLHFATTLAMETLAFANTHDARDTELAYCDLVDAVVARDLVFIGCVLVAALNGQLVGDCGAPIKQHLCSVVLWGRSQ